MCLSQVVILRCVLKVTFQNALVFSVGQRRGTGRNTARQNEYSYHMEVRTLNARRMFREQENNYLNDPRERP